MCGQVLSLKTARDNQPASDNQEAEPTLRSSLGYFNIGTDCLFCGAEASDHKETKKAVKYRRVVH